MTLARRGRDLFELLEARRAITGTKPGKKRRRRSSSSGWADRFRVVLSAILALGERRPRRRISGGMRHPGIKLSGAWLTAMLVMALGLGFLLGRGMSGVQAAEQKLVLPATNGPAAERPGLLPGMDTPRNSAPDLSLQKEVETLSKYFYVVLPYPDSERDRASQLAYYLRQHGFEDYARIKLFPSSREGFFLWAVLVYVPDPAQGPGLVQQLKTVPPPDFEPRFAQRVAGSMDLTKLTAENEGR